MLNRFNSFVRLDSSSFWQWRFKWSVSNLRLLIYILWFFSPRAFVPAVLLGEAEPKVNEQSPKTQEQSSVRNRVVLFYSRNFSLSLRLLIITDFILNWAFSSSLQSHAYWISLSFIGKLFFVICWLLAISCRTATYSFLCFKHLFFEIHCLTFQLLLTLLASCLHILEDVLKVVSGFLFHYPSNSWFA